MDVQPASSPKEVPKLQPSPPFPYRWYKKVLLVMVALILVIGLAVGGAVMFFKDTGGLKGKVKLLLSDKPDLIIDGVSVDVYMQEGYNIIFSVTVRNQGEGEAASSGLRISGEQEINGEAQIDAIPGGQSKKVEVKVAMPESNEIKTYVLTIVADNGDRIEESDETNNEKVVDVKVTSRSAMEAGQEAREAEAEEKLAPRGTGEAEVKVVEDERQGFVIRTVKPGEEEVGLAVFYVEVKEDIVVNSVNLTGYMETDQDDLWLSDLIKGAYLVVYTYEENTYQEEARVGPVKPNSQGEIKFGALDFDWEDYKFMALVADIEADALAEGEEARVFFDLAGAYDLDISKKSGRLAVIGAEGQKYVSPNQESVFYITVSND